MESGFDIFSALWVTFFGGVFGAFYGLAFARIKKGKAASPNFSPLRDTTIVASGLAAILFFTIAILGVTPIVKETIKPKLFSSQHKTFQLRRPRFHL